MAVTLVLQTRDDNTLAAVLGQEVLAVTPIANLPSLERVQADPHRVGRALFAALGGEALRNKLRADPEQLLLLDADTRAEESPWEFAAPGDNQFLAAEFGMLRLVDGAAMPNGPQEGRPQGSSLQFVALAADPLVDAQGSPRTGYRLDLENEMRAIRQVLRASGKEIQARRVPPTKDALRRALRRGPAILHLTCHGDLIQTNNGPQALVLLEDADGKSDPLLGRDLMVMPPAGVLRLVLLSACRTAQGTEAQLARALVQNGVPFAIGMQGLFDDRLSDDIAVALYESVLAGLSLAESLRQMRHTLLSHGDMFGLPVGYTAREGWRALSLNDGAPAVGNLGLPGQVVVNSQVQPPRPLLGRNGELHELAHLYSNGKRVVTINGTGGMGKTALAASFIERFAWRWAGGVRVVSFANETIDARAFRIELVRLLSGEQAARDLADASAEMQANAILETLRDWDGLVVLDNYETILQAVGEANADAEHIHWLAGQMANGGAALLLTSREPPAGLAGEVLYPAPNEPLSGLDVTPGAELFIRHSTKAQDQPDAHKKLAREIARVTDGHPLALALLAGEYDTSPVSAETFLQNWESELASAARPGLMGHHRTFTLAFERSYNHLSAGDQTRLRALSIFPFPFYAEGAALVWNADTDNETWETHVREQLGQFTRRNLLEIDGWFEGNIPSAFRFQPALRQQVANRLSDAEREQLKPAFARYAAWFVALAYDRLGREPAVARRAQQATRTLIEQADAQPPENVARYCWLLGTVLYQFGDITQAENVLQRGMTAAQAHGDVVREERILFALARIAAMRGDLTRALADYGRAAELAQQEKNQGEYSVVINEMAGIYVTRGDLNGAMQLYQQSLQIQEQLGDRKGKSATLHQMAGIYVTRGDLNGAMQLYQQSLQIQEQLGDRKGKSATLHQMAGIYVTRGDLNGAMQLYQQSAAIDEQLGDLQGKSATLHQMAGIYVTRGDLNGAMQLYQQSLQIKEQLGDLQGKSATLHQMAGIYVTRGDLNGAMQLYQQSAAIDEQLGDLQGKSATLHQMAGIYVTRGDLNGAMQLYQQSLQIKEQLGDLQGKSATLAGMGNILMANGKLDEAERVFLESLNLNQQIAQPLGVAFNFVYLGQIAQARGDRETALARYREGLAIFEQLGMPRESAQVREMLTDLENPNAPRPAQPTNPLQQAIAQARAAAEQGDMDAAIRAQEHAVEIARERGDGREELVTLSVMLYNLSNYYAEAEQFDEAVNALEQVVALDEQTGHPDLASDRQALEQMQKIAALSPQERAAIRARAQEAEAASDADSLQAQLDAMPPEERAQLEATAREMQARLAQMTPEERQALADRARREQIENVADQTRDAAVRALRGEIPRERVVAEIERVAAQAEQGEPPGSPWREVATFMRAVAALLNGNPNQVVPSAYAAHWAAIRDAG